MQCLQSSKILRNKNQPMERNQKSTHTQNWWLPKDGSGTKGKYLDALQSVVMPRKQSDQNLPQNVRNSDHR